MYKIIRKHELSTTQWSGGTTTQLAIWPPQAEYAARNFTWRVSTARVDASESEFTRLPGVSRILMVLEGTLRLRHEDGREVILNRFEQDRFDGGQRTVSYGCVRDFNLMMSDCEGEATATEIPAAKQIQLPAPALRNGRGHASEVLYFLSPAQMALPGGPAESLDAGDVVIFRDRADAVALLNPSPAAAHIVRAVAYHD